MNNEKKISFFEIQENGQKALDKSQDFLKLENDDINNGMKLVKTIIREAATIINKQADFNLNNYHNGTRILFCLYNEGIELFQNTFKPLYKNSIFKLIPIKKNSSAFSSLRKQLIEDFNKYDLIVYTADDKSDADLLSYLQSHQKTFSKKVIILNHNSPVMFDNNVLKDSTIISTFTNHTYTYEIDVEILTNKVTPKALENLPINIGGNAKYYNVAYTSFIEPTNILTYENLFPKYLVDNRTVNIIKRKNYIISKVTVKKIVFIIFNVFCFTFLVQKLARFISQLKKRIVEKDLFFDYKGLFTHFFIRHPILFIYAIIFFLINIIWFKDELISIKTFFFT